MSNKYPNQTMKTALNRAFHVLRHSYGYLARQNFLCCQSCAWAEAECIIESHPGKYHGVVFYHKQDAETLYNQKPWTYLSFGVTSEKQTVPTCKEIGEAVVRVMKAQGLQVDWDGDTDHRIKIYLPKPTPTFVGEGI